MKKISIFSFSLKTMGVLWGFLGMGMSGYAQPEETAARPSADVWEFIKYGNVPVNLYSGMLNLTIPLYQYKDKDFNVPVTLGYASGGWLPNRLQGSLSPGWYLTGGGCITRQIRGVPDEEDGVERRRYTEYFRKSTNESLPTYFQYFPGKGCISTYSLYLSPSSYTGYDPQPDVFYFNFLGYSGSFQLGRNNQIHVYNTNVPAGEIKINIRPGEQYSDMSAFSITTGEGTVYYFGEFQDENDVATREYTEILKRSDASTERQTTSWMLTRIVAPDGREIKFKYREGGIQMDPILTANVERNRVSSPLTSLNWNASYQTTSGSNEFFFETARVFPLILEEMVVDNQLRVKYFHSDHPGDYCLDSLKVTNLKTGRELKKCRFFYLWKGSTSRFLQQVEISGEGNYRMEYYNEDQTPPYRSFSVDHWGFYNGKSGASFSFLPEVSVNADFEETIVGSSRNPDATYGGFGMLKKITYPTGGCSEFDYQGNDYAQAVRRDKSSRFLPYLKPENTAQPAGGVRVWKIRDMTPEGQVISREFTYKTANNLSSGILLKYPRYYTHYKGMSTDGNYYYLRECSSYSSLHNSVYTLDEGHLGYSRVVEKREDNSTIEYEYSDYATCPDDEAGIVNYGNGGGYQIELSLRDYVNNLYSSLNSRHRDRGKLLRKRMRDSAGKLVYQETYVYDTTPLPYFEDINLCGDIFRKTRIYTADHLLRQEVKTSYYGNDSVVSATAYAYNTLGEKISTETKDSRGVVYKEQIQYVGDIIAGDRTSVETAMVNRNILAHPLKTEKRFRPENGTEKLFGGEQTEFGLFNNLILPAAFRKACLDQPTSAPLFQSSLYTDTELTYDLYDKKGNILQTTAKDGKKTIYIWGYGGLYLIGKVENTTLAKVKGISGLSSIENAPLTGALSGTQETELRKLSGALVTVYDYLPYVGVVSITDATGIKVQYEYDSYGRLKNVMDGEGCLKENYEYHVQQ